MPDKAPAVCQRCYRLSNYGDIKDALRIKDYTPPPRPPPNKQTDPLDELLPPKQEETVAGFGADTASALSSRVLTPSSFRQNLQRLQKIRACVIYLVDVFDFHGTFLSDLPSLIGKNTPVIFGVNKVDLLPDGYRPQRVADWVRSECKDLGLHHVESIHLISCLNGTGVRKLLSDSMKLAARNNADIYVVGAANVGKSSFINQLLRLRKGHTVRRKLQKLEQARADARAKGLLEEEFDESKYAQGLILGPPDPSTAQMLGKVGENEYVDTEYVPTLPKFTKKRIMRLNTSMKPSELLTTSVVPGTTLGSVKITLDSKRALYDTPGIIIPHHYTNLLATEDLKLVIPAKKIIVTTLRVPPGKCLYVGALARVELAEGRPYYLTAFFSPDVKIHLGPALNAADFVEKHVGQLLTPPSSPAGYAALGELDTQDIAFDGGHSWKKAFVDIVFSGLGWVSLTGCQPVTLRVTRPKTVGLFAREPLMPFEVMEGVSTFTGGRAVNRKKVNAVRKRKPISGR